MPELHLDSSLEGSRAPLASLLFTSRKEGNIKKPPLISHKMAANRTDAFMVLAA
jgi:hypothetical protein